MLLAITYVSNLLFLTAFNSHPLFEASTRSLFKLDYLCILGLAVYIFNHKEEKRLSQQNGSQKKRKIC